jgi:hypothetical protein
LKHKAKDNKSINSVAAVSSACGGPFRGISIARKGGFLKLVSSLTASDEQNSFAEFVKDFMKGRKGHVDHLAVVAELRASSFYRISIPPVRVSQADAIISMQCESLVPVAIDRMKIAHRIDPVCDGKCAVTLAVAGKEQVQQCVEMASGLSANGVILTAEAVAGAWRKLFSGGCDDAVLVYVQQDRSLVLEVVSGRLGGAVTIEVGKDQLLSEETASSSRSLFTHDLRDALSMFSGGVSSNVFVLSSDAEQYDELINSFATANITAQASIPLGVRLKGAEDFDAEQIMEYIEPLGACFVALDPEGGCIDFYKGGPDKEALDAKSDSLKSLIAPCLILFAVLALFMVASKAMDRASLSRLSSPEIDRIIADQKLRKLVAQKRVDFVELLSKIEAALPPGMKIKSFSCERGKAMSLSSVADSIDQVLGLQEKLKGQKGITEVNIASSRTDEKTGKIDFKMTFHYKEYTKKSSGL